MEEMSEQDYQTDAARTRWMRIAANVARIVHLLAASFWLLAFALVVRTGYLSWIGLTVGAVFVGSAAISPLLGWAGRRRGESVLVGVHLGMMILAAIVWLSTSLGPQDKGTWRPYRFDDVLAAMEAKRAVPDAENAAPRYKSVLADLNMADQPDFLFAGSFLREEFEKQPWKANDHPQASQWLDSQSQVIDRLLAIGAVEKCRWPIQADTYDGYTVPYEKVRRSALLLIAAGNRDLGEGRVTEALTKYFCTLRIADHLHQQSSQVDSLAGYYYEGVALRMMRQVLVQSNLSEADLVQIAHYLPPPADPWPEEWKRLSELEKLHYMNLLGRLYEVDEEGHVRFARKIVISPRNRREQKDPTRIPRLYWLMSMPRDPHAVRGVVNKYFATFDGRVGSSRPLQPAQDKRSPRVSVNDLSKAICNIHRWGLEMVFFNEQECIRHRRWCVPSFAACRGTWLILGLRRYHDAHGVWPRTLDAISEYVPAETLVDPTNGEPFVYVTEGDGFRLYSKGPNRIDEGGRSGYVRASKKVEDDIWIWPPPPPAPEPSEDEVRQQMEQIYGKNYMEAIMKD
ncbi:MAG: hypothetical protein M1376_02090 [Planctomycetes bacterium]|nr:hypothetical protein [Planctomycetota bacterium]